VTATDHRTLRIATIGGDGIGPEVVRATLPSLVAAAEGHGATVEITELDWGGDRLLRTGHAMPLDGPDQLRRHDAVLLGAVGHPELSPSDSVWTLVLPIRKALDLFVNLRPIHAWPGVPSPIRNSPHADFVVVRENTEGEYSGIGGRVHQGSPDEIATDVAVHTRRAITRVGRYAFALARARGQTLTLVTKSNVSRFGYALWDEVVFELGAAEFPDVAVEKSYVDAMAARLIERPASLGVLVCSNLFGDILSDAGAPIAGGLGMAPSANISPDGDGPGMFEPVHGSAPDIAGRDAVARRRPRRGRRHPRAGGRGRSGLRGGPDSGCRWPGDDPGGGRRGRARGGPGPPGARGRALSFSPPHHGAEQVRLRIGGRPNTSSLSDPRATRS
jgi:tartrate dehydrogenase/decarboxylase/D-malate dehydrogenase